MSYLAWYDPDAKYPRARKLKDGISRYREKYGAEPEVCLTSVADAAALAGDPDRPDIPVTGETYIPASTFYIGVHDPAPESTT